MKRLVSFVALALGGAAFAQESPGFRLEEHAFNSGGHPLAGAVLSSASFRMTLGAVGGIVALAPSSSASFSLETGFAGAYPPPGEVPGLRFTAASTLAWGAERSAGTYNLYQGAVTRPFDPSYGACQRSGIVAPGASVPATPPPGQALFFLVTAENRLAEEGTKGTTGAGVPRDNSNPCP